MAKFKVGRAGGQGGAGWVGGHYFADIVLDYETNDPAMIEALRKSGVATELHEPPPKLQIVEKPLEEMSHRELAELSKKAGVPVARSKVDIIKAIRSHAAEEELTDDEPDEPEGT
jgi:hypothetical protein